MLLFAATEATFALHCIYSCFFQGHDLFTKHHKLTQIDDYEKAPERYRVEMCKEHEQYPIIEVCEDCEMPFCKRCSTRVYCLVGKGEFYTMFVLMVPSVNIFRLCVWLLQGEIPPMAPYATFLT